MRRDGIGWHGRGWDGILYYTILIPVTSYLLPVTCYLLPVSCYLLPVTSYLLPATCYLLPVICYLLPVTCACYRYLYLLPLLLLLLPGAVLNHGIHVKPLQLSATPRAHTQSAQTYKNRGSLANGRRTQGTL